MINRKVLGARSKRQGNDAERYYMNIFKDLGFKHCKTSRFGSKMHDSAGIDLIFVPFNIQIKYGEQKGMKPGGELELMKNKIKNQFPDNSVENDLPKILIHKKPVGAGKKATEFHQLVTMTFEDFIKIIQKGQWIPQ